MIRGYGDGHNNLTVTSVVVASAALATQTRSTARSLVFTVLAHWSLQVLRELDNSISWQITDQFP